MAAGGSNQEIVESADPVVDGDVEELKQSRDSRKFFWRYRYRYGGQHREAIKR